MGVFFLQVTNNDLETQMRWMTDVIYIFYVQSITNILCCCYCAFYISLVNTEKLGEGVPGLSEGITSSSLILLLHIRGSPIHIYANRSNHFPKKVVCTRSLFLNIICYFSLSINLELYGDDNVLTPSILTRMNV